ncbi:MAG: MerR family transcriptional regulator [Gammaproteobacteria bacterium]|nr:MerR family transcriptional regulator [Gammaproteobacteria bacterium]
MGQSRTLHSIGSVERDTGIGRDTLRVWERRYGFPVPKRNDKGERLYSDEQLRHLQRIRRLMDFGLRPGRLLKLDAVGLDALEAEILSARPAIGEENIRHVLEVVRAHDSVGLEQLLDESYRSQGMEDFILKTVAPLLHAVGEAWAAGEIAVYEEHYLSQQLIHFLHTRLNRQPRPTGSPRILLATLPGELHTLGLLMTLTVLRARGVHAINLGGEVPMDQVKEAARRFQVEAVGLTFSSAYPHHSIRGDIEELRARLPAETQIWVGGEGVWRLRKLPEGVFKFQSLEKLPI